jgi:predicted PurR-regulated permease PerM
MSSEQPDTWRSRVSGSADRRGIPLATIVAAVAITIGLLDLNVALIVVLWVLRKIVLYTVVAFFFALLLTPATRFLGRRGLSHGGATALVFLLGALILGGLVYLFVSPLVTGAEHFGHELPSLIRDARKGRGPLGHLVYRLHLQKYLAKGSTQISDQLTKVLKPATAFSVGAAAVSSLITIGTIAVLTYFAMLEAPRLWRGLLGLFSPPTALRLNRVINETVRAVTGYVLGDAMTSVIAGVVVGITLTVFDVPFAILLGVFVALVDLLPLVGGLIAGVPVVILAAIHSVPAGIITLVIFLAYQQIENHFLNPVIMSRTVRLNPLWVLLAVLIGATLGGRLAGGLGAFIGALIGIPLGGALQVVMREIRRGPEVLEDLAAGPGASVTDVTVETSVVVTE